MNEEKIFIYVFGSMIIGVLITAILGFALNDSDKKDTLLSNIIDDSTNDLTDDEDDNIQGDDSGDEMTSDEFMKNFAEELQKKMIRDDDDEAGDNNDNDNVFPEVDADSGTGFTGSAEAEF